MTTIPQGTRLVVGLGCASAATADEVVALVKASLAERHLVLADVVALATLMRRRDSLALALAATRLDLPLRFLDDDDLSPHIASTCEAVAAAAGTLLQGKRKSRFATCALAVAAPGFDVAAFGQPPSPSATMASSMLATSVAGP